MNVTFSCPRCEATGRVECTADAEDLACPNCHLRISMPADAFEDGHLRRCVVCPSSDLFVRKDFPQRLGVAIVVAGFAASCVTWYWYMPYATFGILFATALIDMALYFLCGDALNCYRCGAIYRDVEGLEDHPVFHLEVHERHRQQAAREEELMSKG